MTVGYGIWFDHGKRSVCCHYWIKLMLNVYRKNTRIIQKKPVFFIYMYFLLFRQLFLIFTPYFSVFLSIQNAKHTRAEGTT